MSEGTNVHVQVRDRVAVLWIDHPPVNALDEATLGDLESAFARALADDEVKAIVITGTGRSFVAGADIASLAETVSARDLEALARRGQALMMSIERSPKPVIAAINGRFCLGGGNELAIACHIRIAESRCKFGQPEVTLGLIPGWGASARLPRLVGLGKAVELVLTGEHIRAEEAHRIGMVQRVVPEGEALDEALRLARHLAALSAEAVRRALDCIYSELDVPLAEAMAYEAMRFGEMGSTEDMHEGLRAFLEKRRPNYQDR